MEETNFIEDNPTIILSAWQRAYIKDFINRWEADEDILNNDKLSDEFHDFCKDNNLPQWSADEILAADQSNP